MKPNTIPEIVKIVNEATTPVIILVVSEMCNEFKLQVQEDVEKAIMTNGVPVAVFTLCLPEESIVFPRPITPILYYYLPKNQTPIFWRSGMLTATIAADLDIAYKMMSGMTEFEARYTPEQVASIKETEKHLAEEKKLQFPPKFQQARNLAKEMWAVAKRGAGNLPILVPAEVGKTRFDTCQACDKFEHSSNRCSLCGCNMVLKTQLATSKCPAEKW